MSQHVPEDPDTLTDYLAAGIATIALLWLLGIATHMYLTDGTISSEILYAILGLVAVSAATLFGVDKIKKIWFRGD